MSSPEVSNYRADIDGLRAVAILAVLLFHAFPEQITGGFIGVDVFFVISGYLISTIVFAHFHSGTWRFADFYRRRIKRLFPALIVVLVATLYFGWNALFAEEYMQLGQHVTAGSWFVQNFLLWSEAGYFDVASTLKPLTHLWSLAIEEQFYLVYPALIFLLWRCRSSMFGILMLLFVLSFGYNVYLIDRNEVALFYSPLTRAWELLSGSLLAYGPYLSSHAQNGNVFLRIISRAKILEVQSSVLPASVANNLSSLVGLLLILLGVFGIRDGHNYPGLHAILAVLGAFLLIRAGAASWANKYLLAHPLMVFIGLISYPLYLWHWPVLSYLHILVPDSSPTARFIAVAISVVLAWLTYRLVEIPLRFRKHADRLITGVLCSAMVLISIAGYSVAQFRGIPERPVIAANPVMESGKTLTQPLAHIQKGCGLPEEDVKDFYGCLHDSRGHPKLALYGDSKAGTFAMGLLSRSTPDNAWLFIGGNGPEGGTVPVIDSEFAPYVPYTALTQKAFRAISQNQDIEVVVLYTATRALFQLPDEKSLSQLPDSPWADVAYKGLNKAVELLIQAGKKVVLMVDNPTLPDPKVCIGRVTEFGWLNSALDLRPVSHCQISYDMQLKLSDKYRQVLDKTRSNHPDKIRIFDPTQLLCDMKSRECSSLLNGRLMYSNTDHISEEGGMRIADKLVPFVERFMRNEPTEDQFNLQRFTP